MRVKITSMVLWVCEDRKDLLEFVFLSNWTRKRMKVMIWYPDFQGLLIIESVGIESVWPQKDLYNFLNYFLKILVSQWLKGVGVGWVYRVWGLDWWSIHQWPTLYMLLDLIPAFFFLIFLSFILLLLLYIIVTIIKVGFQALGFASCLIYWGVFC